ncbi:MAG TPA: FeoA family protein [Oscillospiraceae bacterium]|nr:FeoA family protein [Oscillospiraceae bacterium]
MNKNYLPLFEVNVGSRARVSELLSIGLSRRRMLDLGLIPGTIINVIRKSPLGDPIAYNIRGALIALRKEEATQILVSKIN